MGKPDKEPRTYQVRGTEDAGPVAKIGTQEYGFHYLGPLAGFDLVKPTGEVREVRRRLVRGLPVWTCNCEGYTYCRGPAKTCRHVKLGIVLGLIEQPEQAARPAGAAPVKRVG